MNYVIEKYIELHAWHTGNALQVFVIICCHYPHTDLRWPEIQIVNTKGLSSNMEEVIDLSGRPQRKGWEEGDKRNYLLWIFKRHSFISQKIFFYTIRFAYDKDNTCSF